eukprot:TRINITY_DN16419_c0_g1_i1.p1 TRINITY_DN16419_c0_g1~~TRINITY_DN16419_c0_g1_i1.p1  ORF type:complete len:307 (+),score=27.77 TRINITY_DN16419_c0_g1_i1:48-923(+)
MQPGGKTVKISKHLPLGATLALGAVLGLHWVVDGGFPQSKASLKIDEERKVIIVPVWITADFMCPWSFLARKSLAQAQKDFPNVELVVKWNPVLLYSNLPIVGNIPMGVWAETAQTIGRRKWEILKDPEGGLIDKGIMLGADIKLSDTQLVGSPLNAHKAAFRTLQLLGPDWQDKMVMALYSEMWEKQGEISSPWNILKVIKKANIPLDHQEIMEYLMSDQDNKVVQRIALLSREKGKMFGSPQMNFACRVEPVVGITRPTDYARVLEEYQQYLYQELNDRGIELHSVARS